MTDNDDLFRKLFADVVPLKNAKPLLKHASKKSAAKHRSPASGLRHPVHIESTHAFSLESQPWQWLSANSELSFKRAGVQLRVLQKLKAAKYPIDANLDLHGYKVEQAAQQLQDFIREAVQRNCKCVVIIHGRGHRNVDQKAILKTYVAHWLPQIPAVLAYHSAQQQHGGLGAIYILLRNTVAHQQPVDLHADK